MATIRTSYAVDGRWVTPVPYYRINDRGQDEVDGFTIVVEYRARKRCVWDAGTDDADKALAIANDHVRRHQCGLVRSQ